MRLTMMFFSFSVLFLAMILHYVERSQFLAQLAARDEKITRLFAENKALEDVALELINDD